MLGIVIANWNGEKLLDKCLESLSNQKYKNFKVYIIDNNSVDKSKEIIKEYSKKINILLTELYYNSGFAKANNIGIKQGIEDKCEYILTLNNDVEVPEESLEKAMAEVAKSNCDVFQLLMINYFNRDNCDAAGLNFDKALIPIQVGYDEGVKKILESHEEINIEGVCAGAAIYSAKALEKVKLQDDNYFDSNFFAYYEDVDLSLRLKNAGFKCRLLKNSIVYHMHSATGGKTNGFKEYYLIRNLFIYTRRNQSKEDYKKNRVNYYVRFIKNMVKNIGNLKALKATIKGLKDGIKDSKVLS